MAKFPQLIGHVQGSDFPPGPLHKTLGLIASVASFGALGASFVPSLAPMLGLPVDQLPSPLLWLAENKLYGLLAYTGFNFLSQRLIATGAYEVTYNGELIYSALENGGAVPQASYIAHLLEMRGLASSSPAAENGEAVDNREAHIVDGEF